MTVTDERGFTLAELLVALTLLATVLTAVMLLQQQGQSIYMMHAARIEAQQNGRVAVDLITRELRSATAVTALAASNLTFVDQSGVTIGYRLNAADLERTENGVLGILIGGVETLTFAYSDANGATTTDPTRVATVSVSLVTKPEHTTAASVWQLQPRTIVQDRIRLRNVI